MRQCSEQAMGQEVVSAWTITLSPAPRSFAQSVTTNAALADPQAPTAKHAVPTDLPCPHALACQGFTMMGFQLPVPPAIIPVKHAQISPLATLAMKSQLSGLSLRPVPTATASVGTTTLVPQSALPVTTPASNAPLPSALAAFRVFLPQTG